MPRLGPAWRTGGGAGRGFQPPPAVPDGGRGAISSGTGNNESSSRDRSGSHASAGSSDKRMESASNRNPFSLLDDEDGGSGRHDESSSSGGGGIRRGDRASHVGPPPSTNDRFGSLRSNSASSAFPSFNRSASTGAKVTGGRSLADLAAGLSPASSGPSSGLSRSSSTGYRSSGDHDRGGGGSGIGDGVSRGGGSGGDGGAKVIRYTREKLLSLRPVPKEDEGPPAILKHLEGSVVISKAPQDPGELAIVCFQFFPLHFLTTSRIESNVMIAKKLILSNVVFHFLAFSLSVCWDTFDADEIWAQAARERRVTAPKGVGRLRDHDGDERGGRTGSGSAFGSGGRWQRGVALPPDDSRGSRGSSTPDLLTTRMLLLLFLPQKGGSSRKKGNRIA